MTEVLIVNVKLTGFYEVKGSAGCAKMITFDGDVDCDNFRGMILPGGVDTQTIGDDGIIHLSARYILEGEDLTGESCKIFIENNGEVLPDGSIKTIPKILTNSNALKYLETEVLNGTVEGVVGGVVIHIYKA